MAASISERNLESGPGGPWASMGPLGGPWGSVGVHGGSLGGPEASLGAAVSPTDRFVMYTYVFMISPRATPHINGHLSVTVLAGFGPE